MPVLKENVVISTSTFNWAGKRLSRIVTGLCTRGFAEEMAQLAVFVFLWHNLAGSRTDAEYLCNLEELINGILAPATPLRELLVTLRHDKNILPINVRQELAELGTGLEKKIPFNHREEFNSLLGMIYEAFLKHYSPYEQKRYGVYSTPLPLVDFMVRSIHQLVKRDFYLPKGIASGDVSLLDPAAGTGVFLDSAINLAVKTMTGNLGQKKIKEFSSHFLQEHCFSYEKLFIPYMLNVLCLCSKVYKVADENLLSGECPEFRVYWRNILEMDINILLSGLTGKKGKDKERVLPVIIGNPPYAVHSANNHTPAAATIKAYFSIAGKRLVERNFKALQDDYIKFIRQAQLIVDKAGRGIIAFVTNNAYLDNITFRGMRHSLLQDFNKIYILNLNGDKHNEQVPGEPGNTGDKNIFNTGMGTAVSFFIKCERKTTVKKCHVYYAEIMGNKADKFQFLLEKDVTSLNFEKIHPKKDFFLFKPVCESITKISARYRYFFKLTEIFPVSGVGIITARDKLTIRYSAADILETVTRFAKLDENATRRYFKLGPDSRDWNIENAKQDILEHEPEQAWIVPILYRPFDMRFTYFTGKCRGFHCMPRWKLMRHMLFENLALITVRQVKAGKFNHCYAASSLIDCRVTTNNKGISYIFPLYTYRFPPEQKGKRKPALIKQLLQSGANKKFGRIPNINPEFLNVLVNTLNLTESLKVEQIFYYIYGVLFSNKYRKTYSEQLQVDFPCVPFTTDNEVFIEISRLGEELCELHLFTSTRLQEPIFSFHGEGDCLVKRNEVRFVVTEEGRGRVYINETQFFGNIPLAVWEAEFCGYRILLKWLKTRREARLSVEDINHFNMIVNALHLTIDYQKRIDELYNRIEERLLIRK